MFERTFSFWRRLVGRDEPAADQPRQEERRVWARYPAELKTRAQVGGAVVPQRVSVVVRDISLGGANLEINRSFAPGSLLSLELPSSEEGNTHEVLACVVRLSDLGEGKWGLGCIFSRELTDQDLEGFGAKKIRNDPRDQRTWMRFPVNLSARLQRVEAPHQSPQEGQILNISPSGVGLLVSQPVPAGTLLTVELINAEDKVVKTILACVVHLTGHPDGSCTLGCNFIRQLKEMELHALVQTV